jgi:hypothetical protein
MNMQLYRPTSSARPVVVAVLAVAGVAIVTLIAGHAAARSAPLSAPDRRMAITIDDLPFLATDLDAASIDEMTGRLLTALQTRRTPAIGFVNEGKLDDGGGKEAQVRRLTRRRG